MDTSKYETRELTPNESAQLKTFLQGQVDRWSKKEKRPPGTERRFDGTDHYYRVDDFLRNIPYSTAFGKFRKNEDGTETMVQECLTSLSAHQPCWYLHVFHSSDPMLNPSDLYQYILKWYEDRGIHKFYAAYPSGRVALYQRLWRQAEVDYTSYTEMTVPPNTRCPYEEIFNTVLGRSLQSKEFVVRAFIHNSLLNGKSNG